jgi:uncharacterized phage protein gp47/JayE
VDFPTFRQLFQSGRAEILATPGNRVPATVIDRDGSTVNVLVASSAAMGDELARQAVTAFRATFVDTASGQDLDRLAFDRFNLLRKPAAPTIGQVTITRPAPGPVGTLPAGHRIRDPQSGITVELTSAVSFAGADTSKTGNVRGLVAGAGQDLLAGRLTQFVDAPFDSTLRATNAAPTTGSGDAETDPAFRDRIRLFFTASQKGTIAAIQLGALSVVGVDKVTVIEVIDTDGTPARLVECFVADVAGNVNQTLADAVKDALVDFRAAGINVIVPVSTAQFVDIELELSFQAGVDTLAAETAAKDAVVVFVNSLRPGQTLTVSGIAAAVLQIQGITNVIVRVPVGDLVPAIGQTIRTAAGNVIVL